MSTVAVIGHGYVGREVALAAQKHGHQVFAIDKDLSKLQNVEEYQVSDNLDYLHISDIVIICLPTDSDYYRSMLVEIQRISDFMSPGSLLIIESTVGLGYMQLIKSVLPDEIKLAYSPERIDPGNDKYTILNTPKILSAFDDESYKIAHNFYASFVENITRTTVAEAEATKLLENSFRLVNISFINELAILFNKLGINANRVIDIATTKPYGYMPFKPGIGAGGHCIPVDPTFLSGTAEVEGVVLDVLNSAVDANREIFYEYVAKVYDLIKESDDKRVMVVGISYKPNVKDVRNSASIKLINSLRNMGAEVVWHDDVVGDWSGEQSAPLTTDVNVAIIVHRHWGINTYELKAQHIIDCENM